MEIKDSGNRQVFESGAVRDIQEGKGRCDLLPLDFFRIQRSDDVDYSYNDKTFNYYCEIFDYIEQFKQTGDVCHLRDCLRRISNLMYFGYADMLLDLSIHFEDGAKKYNENNWKKGIPAKRYIDSATRHLLKFIRGDNDEPHKRAFAWNVMCCIWTCEHIPDLNDYRKDSENGN